MNCNIYRMVCIKIKTTILIVFMILISLQTSGQTPKVERIHIANVIFLDVKRVGLTYSFEQPFSKTAVLKIEPGLLAGYGHDDETGDFWEIEPAISLEPRLYYNYLRRQRNAKNTTNNSADFLAFVIHYVPKWLFEFATGVGIYKSESNDYWAGFPVIDIRFGYRF